MSFATVSGKLIDSDGIAWRQATWTAVPVSPSSHPVFADGTPVPTMSGTLDDQGTFSGTVPVTLSILPPGTTLTFTITSLTSFAPQTITKVQIIGPTTVDLGALLSPRISAPRIPASAIVYAYDAKEITNPKHGNGYVNTILDQSFIYMQNSWQAIGAKPVFDDVTANTVEAGNLFATQPALKTIPESLRISNPSDGAYFDAFGNTPTAESSMRFRVASSDGSLFSPVLYLDNSTFQCFRNFAMELDNSAASVISPSTGLMLTWNMGGLHRTGFVNAAASGGGFSWYAVPSGSPVNGSVTPMMTLDYSAGGLQMFSGGKFSLEDSNNAGKLVISQVAGGGGALYDSFGVNTGNYAGHTFRCDNSDGSGHFDVLAITSANGGAVNIKGDLTSNTLYLNRPGAAKTIISNDNAQTTYIDAYSTGTTTLGIFAFRVVSSDGSLNSTVMEIQNQDVYVAGILHASNKQFRITHPLDTEKWLHHGCLEGPENGVYYRGEATTNQGGLATIELPEYFEALTRADGRTVQLTAIDDGEEHPEFQEIPTLAASRVKDGAFSVRSSAAGVSFFWEVKAVRADIEPLAVEVPKVNQAEPEPTK